MASLLSSVASLRRQFSQHVRDAEIASEAECHPTPADQNNSIDSSAFLKKNNSLEISEVHSPLVRRCKLNAVDP